MQRDAGGGKVERDAGARPPEALDTSTPNIARMHHYLLGGRETFQADRVAAERALAALPAMRTSAIASRQFLRRAVTFLAAEAGIDQFLDIGPGLPAKGAVHEVAHEVNPRARVVYADYDPIVVSHGTAMLAHSDQSVVVQADLRQPDALLQVPAVRQHLDFDRPVALLLLAIVHFVSDADDPAGIIARLRDALPPGSYLALTHVSADLARTRRPPGAPWPPMRRPARGDGRGAGRRSSGSSTASSSSIPAWCPSRGGGRCPLTRRRTCPTSAGPESGRRPEMPAPDDAAPLPDAFVVRILRSDGEVAGVGTLVGDRRILTCAHVVNVALGAEPLAQARPDGEVLVDFPLVAPGMEPLAARVGAWVAPPRPGAGGERRRRIAARRGFSGGDRGGQARGRAGPGRDRHFGCSGTRSSRRSRMVSG